MKEVVEVDKKDVENLIIAWENYSTVHRKTGKQVAEMHMAVLRLEQAIKR